MFCVLVFCREIVPELAIASSAPEITFGRGAAVATTDIDNIEQRVATWTVFCHIGKAFFCFVDVRQAEESILDFFHV